MNWLAVHLNPVKRISAEPYAAIVFVALWASVVLLMSGRMFNKRRDTCKEFVLPLLVRCIAWD